MAEEASEFPVLDGEVAEHVSTYHGGAVRVSEAEGKGRVLVAVCDFEPGERILLEYPLVEAKANKAAPAYVLLEGLKESGAFEFGVLFYWAALCTLTATEVAGARCPAWPIVSAQSQAHALLLHAPPEACEAASASTCSIIDALWPPGIGPDPKRLERLLQSWIYNSFDQGTDGGPEAGVMYLCASMLSHSCSPNAAWHLDDANSYILHARVPIEEGEEITIPYLGPADLCLPTPDRRAILSATKDFCCGCERCVATLDSSRVFHCPRCSQATALAAADTAAAAILVCSACGELTEEEARPALVAEDFLHPWARSQPEFHADADALETATSSGSRDRPALELLREAEGAGLAGVHWIVDTACGASAVQNPSMACELLRQRIAGHESAGRHAVTKCARLYLALGEQLCAEGSAESLKEATAAYGKAEKALAILFGDDHPEAQEAAIAKRMVARKLASASSRRGGTESGGNRDGNQQDEVPLTVGGNQGGKRTAKARRSARQ